MYLFPSKRSRPGGFDHPFGCDIFQAFGSFHHPVGCGISQAVRCLQMDRRFGCFVTHVLAFGTFFPSPPNHSMLVCDDVVVSKSRRISGHSALNLGEGKNCNRLANDTSDRGSKEPTAWKMSHPTGGQKCRPGGVDPRSDVAFAKQLGMSMWIVLAVSTSLFGDPFGGS